MKGSSIATVILIAIIATVVAGLVVNSLLGDPNDASVSVKYIDVISPDILSPDAEVFNGKAVNPTVEVYVGQCKAGEVWDDSLRTCVEERIDDGGETDDADMGE